jgi:uncharacterized protein YbaP (TraB family)
MIKDNMRGIALALMGAFLVLHSYAQPKPAYKSLLWEITGNGMARPSYLYGTMHVSNKVAFHLTDTFFMGINNCDVIALEMNPDTWMADMVKSETMNDEADMMRDFGYYGEVKNFYQKSVDIRIPDRKTIAPALADDPNLVNGMLYRFNDFSANYQEDTYLDLFIYQAAKKLKKRVSELENFQESMEMVQKAMLPDEETDLRLFKKSNTHFDIYDRIEDAYRKGDLDLLDSLSREVQFSRNYQKYLIDERNIIMARNMDSIMRRNTLFAAIGAAHLPGEAGVISLLRQKGYTVRPVAHHVTRSSIKMRTKIEKARVPLTYSRQYVPDSVFSVDLPGPLYELPAFGEFKQYLYPEMVNGVYFCVSRIRTFSPLTGKSEEYIAKSIDSLLYESVPGKILKREAIAGNTQYKGYNIISRTRRGDVLRYNIFISPLEIFIFKMGGTGDYVKDEGEKFFSSIKFRPAASSGWKPYSPSGGGYQIDLPSVRLIETNKGNYKGERLDEIVQALDPSDKGFYMVMRSSLHDFSYIEEDTFELGQIAISFRKQLGVEEISRKHGMMNGYPVIDVKMKGSSGFVHLRSIVRGPHYYTLVARTTSDQEPSKFFGSFRLKDHKYSGGFESFRDTSLYFSVNTIVAAPGKSSFNPNGLGFLMKLYKDQYKEEDVSYLPKKKKQAYYSETTAEAILVRYEQFHKFFSAESKEKFWEERAKMLAFQKTGGMNGSMQHLYEMQQVPDENPMVIRKKKLIESNGQQEMHLVLTDTNSTRGIRVKMILKGGVLYTVLANIDTLTGQSEWVNTFFETFAPADTLIGESPFADKTSLFFSYLKGADSTLRKQALKSVYMVKLEGKHTQELVKYMKTPAFRSLDLSTRASFVNALGDLKHAEVLPFLRAAYKDAGDTATLQFAALNAMIAQKNERAYASFIEMLNIETPLTSNDHEVVYLFGKMRDSLRLAKTLFPALLAYTSYPEYENEVYGLLAELVDSGYVDKSMYASAKPAILKRASEELKRQLASEEGQGNINDYQYGGYYSGYFGYGNYKLNNYSSLLIPYYHEPGVKAYFDKMARSRDDLLRISTFVLMLRNNQHVQDSIWKRYSADVKMRLSLYNHLKAARRLDKFDPQYRTQLDFAKTQLYSGLSSDSLQFIERRLVKTRNTQGYVYFFKRKEQAENFWYLEYIGLMPVDEKNVEVSGIIVERGGPFVSEKEIKEEMDRVMETLAFMGRKRAYGQSFTSYYEDLLEE